MKKIVPFVVLAIALILIAAAGYAIWVFAAYSFTVFQSLNPTIAAGIIAACSTVFVTTISIVLAKLLEQKLIVDKELRSKKTEVYDEFMKFFYGFFNGDIDLSAQDMSEGARKKFMELARLATIWGSDEFVIEYSKFRTIGSSGDGKKIAHQMATLFSVIRRDLGHKNKNIKPIHIYSLFINDAEEILK